MPPCSPSHRPTSSGCWPTPPSARSRSCSPHSPPLRSSSELAGATAMVALRGRLRPTRALRWSIGIGLAALAGVPPLIGFFTKDTVIDAALEGATSGGGLRAWLVVVALFVTVVLTAAYCTRAWLLLDTPVAATGALPDPEPAVVDEERLPLVTATDSADDAEVERVHAHGHRPISLSAALVV